MFCLGRAVIVSWLSAVEHPTKERESAHVTLSSQKFNVKMKSLKIYAHEHCVLSYRFPNIKLFLL